ncbi:MAG: cryptochrome/photolyase family protein [Ferruginibacter sp.]
MKEVTVIFPHQLFKEHPALSAGSHVLLVEEFLFFKQYTFHKQKLVLHRASMKFYESYLQERKIEVSYIGAGSPLSDTRLLLQHLSKQGVQCLHVCDVADDWLQRRLQKGCSKNSIKLVQYKSPGFLNSNADAEEIFKDNRHYFQTAFYIGQRKQRKLLLTAEGGPVGGQWTFDKENRKKYPSGKKPPAMHLPGTNMYVEEAIQYVETMFKDNPGKSTPFIYPVTFSDADKWLEDFFTYRFHEFGTYEDAILKNEHYLHHAVLTPALNTGLSTPLVVTERAVACAAVTGIPLNAAEGFIRQVTGWREFIKIVYTREGRRQRTMNYWGFKKKLPPGFWNGNTGIAPVDCTIRKILQTGYCHHIERLMILGNFLLLCETDPDEVYRWFMEMFIDSYDWVMVPNVYGMTQFADGGLMTTKPYISGSNYILKMSDYKKDSWCEIWDALFWRFMHVHRDFFLQNPRLGMLIKTFDNLPEEKRKHHIRTAENYLTSYD